MTVVLDDGVRNRPDTRAPICDPPPRDSIPSLRSHSTFGERHRKQARSGGCSVQRMASDGARVRVRRIVRVGEASLECTIYGSGDALVLLANAGCSTSYFDEFARRLVPAGLRIVAINMRGVGNSQGSLDGISLHHLAADVAGVIEGLECAPAYVLDHAFGNRVARCLAADRPALVRAVILLAAGGLITPSTPQPLYCAGGAHRTDRTAVDARGTNAGIEPPVIGGVSRQARPITFRKVERHALDNTRCRAPARRSFGDGVRFWPAIAARFR